MITIPADLEQYIKSYIHHQKLIVFGFYDTFFTIEEYYNGTFRVFAGKQLIAKNCMDYDDIKKAIEREVNETGL